MYHLFFYSKFVAFMQHSMFLHYLMFSQYTVNISQNSINYLDEFQSLIFNTQVKVSGRHIADLFNIVCYGINCLEPKG
jgi:hypothetical protein